MGALIKVSGAIDAVTRFIGYNVRWLILAAVLVSAVNAIIRKLFNSSSNAWLETQWLLFGAVFMLAAAYVLQKDAHVRIDVLSSRFSQKTRDWVDIIGHVFMLAPLALIMVWLSWPFFLESLTEGENSSSAGGLPVWPAKFLILAGFSLLAAQMFSELVKRIAMMTGHLPRPVQHEAGHTETSGTGAES